MPDYIESRTNEEQAEVLSSYLPTNDLFGKKNDLTSNLGKFLLGLSPEFRRVREVIRTIRNEYFPETTTNFIENWERQLNIPDDCIDVSADIEERRKNVMLKLNGVNISTNKEIENMLAAAGIEAKVQNALDICTLPLTLPFILVSEQEMPFTLSSQAPSNIQCLLRKYIPAHCQVYFRYA